MTYQQAEEMLVLQERLNQLKQDKKSLDMQIKEVERKLSQYQPLAEEQFLAEKPVVFISKETYETTLFRVDQKTATQRTFIEDPVKLSQELGLEDDLVKKSVRLGDVDKLEPAIKAKFDSIITTKSSHYYTVVKV